MSPKQHNWSMTFAHEDKNPYGTYALNSLLPGIFSERKISHSYKTLYELKDSLAPSSNIFVISGNFSADKEDTGVLLKHLEQGGSAFISAQYFWGHFSDTLNISTYDYFFNTGHLYDRSDTSYLKMVNANLDTTAEFYYRRDNTHNYFNRFDSSKTTVIAKNDYNYPVTIRMQVGKGNLILNSTPLIFSNIYLLSESNNEFVAKTLSYLPNKNLNWTEYYHLGRMEVSTPLRFILSNEALRWAYYIAIISILLFMIFEMKRKQRMIPVIKPLANTTLDFVGTIGNLYFQQGDHKNIIEKRINFFLEQLRAMYWLNTTQLDDTFVKVLSRKSGNNEVEIASLVSLIKSVRSKNSLTDEELFELNDKIEKFHRDLKHH